MGPGLFERLRGLWERIDDQRFVLAVASCASAAAWIALWLKPEGCHCAGHVPGPTWTAFFGTLDTGQLARDWMLMLVAMMAPTTIAPLIDVRRQTFARRRWRVSLAFLVGYAAPWLVAGAAIQYLTAFFAWQAPGSFAPAVVMAGIAILWQVSPAKQICLNRCHGHGSIEAFGWAADLSALRSGLDHGRWCIGSCWAIMAVPMWLPSGHLLGMMAATALVVSERLEPPRAPRWALRWPVTAVRLLRLGMVGSESTPPPGVVR